MKIVILDGELANPGDLSWEGIKKLGELVVYPRTSRAELSQRVRDADVLITNKVPLWRETIEKADKLQYIGLLSTGYNQVDLQAATEKNVVVCNVPEYSTAGVAQHTFALLLEICNHVGHHNKQVKQGRWSTSNEWCFWDYPLEELQGKTMGLVGFGNIGQAVGRIAAAFGMHVLATGSRPTPQGKAIANYVSLDELFRQADVLSLHCPLLPQTQGIINKDNISKMKTGAILLNTARGGLIVDDDLAEGLKSGKLKAAGLDVVSKEPIQVENRLLTTENCLITPHIAWVSKAARGRLLKQVEENLLAFIGGEPINKVN